ncbi:MAG: hypothetical protein P4M09_20715 [Devosia sp.]|nr:hypothetical protein [Devosia sp.]
MAKQLSPEHRTASERAFRIAAKETVSGAARRRAVRSFGPGQRFCEAEGGEGYAAAAAEVDALFRRRFADLRRRLPRHEIPHAIRALRAERRLALKALREKVSGEQGAQRRGRRLRAPLRHRGSLAALVPTGIN